MLHRKKKRNDIALWSWNPCELHLLEDSLESLTWNCLTYAEERSVPSKRVLCRSERDEVQVSKLRGFESQRQTRNPAPSNNPCSSIDWTIVSLIDFKVNAFERRKNSLDYSFDSFDRFLKRTGRFPMANVSVKILNTAGEITKCLGATAHVLQHWHEFSRSQSPQEFAKSMVSTVDLVRNNRLGANLAFCDNRFIPAIGTVAGLAFYEEVWAQLRFAKVINNILHFTYHTKNCHPSWFLKLIYSFCWFIFH